MTRCEPCTDTEHQPADCENHDRPMIHRACTCGCDRPETDPAPYWSAHTADGENPETE